MGSVWQQEGLLPEFDQLTGDLQTDVLIIGGGMAGVLCAHELHQAEATVPEHPVAARSLSRQLQGKPDPYKALFSPSRHLLHPQLAVNAAHALAGWLTPTPPRCPHLGCALKWDRQEHCWDCPCHGSRFAEDGKLLEGPATADLPPQ